MILFDDLKTKMDLGESLSSDEINSLGFDDESNLLSFMDDIAQREVQRCMQTYEFVPLGRGYQTKTLHSPNVDFVIKLLLDYGDRPKEASVADFRTANKCGRGLVTPFIFFNNNGSVDGLVAKKVEVVDASLIKSQGKSFVDSLLNLYGANMDQGFFDCDLIHENYGHQDGRLVNLDFGWSKDLWNENTYVPSDNLHWDAFHMGVHKFRETASALERIIPGMGAYLLDQVHEKYGVGFNRETMGCPRSSSTFIPLAEGLRESVRNLRGNEQKRVYPLVGNPVNNVIYGALESRFDESRGAQ
jgi:hypothetical protein